MDECPHCGRSDGGHTLAEHLDPREHGPVPTLVVAALAALTTATDPDLPALRERVKLASPHCGIELYDWMTPKDRDDLCRARRRIARP